MITLTLDDSQILYVQWQQEVAMMLKAIHAQESMEAAREKAHQVAEN